MSEIKTVWSEIRCDFLDEQDKFWRVDAWPSENDEDQGAVIAYIDDLTSRVLYIDPLARVDDYAQRIINEKLHELEQNRIRVRDEYDSLNVYFETAAGTLVAQLEKKEDIGSDNIYVGVHLPDHDSDYYDLTGVRVVDDKIDVEDDGGNNYEVKSFLFGNPRFEDCTDMATITDVDFDYVYKEMDDNK